MKDIYRTIQFVSEGSYREKGSKFLGFACPVQTEEEIGERLAELKKRFHDARHHCYAWRLGPEMERTRTSDDGEPSNSAGPPIFGQIQSRGLTDVLVVVVRYFGGTLLGVGGLINAYRTAAADALDHSRIAEKKVYGRLYVEFAYEQMDRVMRLVKKNGLQVIDQRFDNRCTLDLEVWKRKEDSIRQELDRIGDCRVFQET